MRSSHAPEVAAAIWPWRQAREARKDASAAARRKRAAVEAAVMTCVAGLLWFRFHKPWAAGAVCALAGLVLLGGLFVPRLYAAFKAAGARLGKAAGLVFSWILLAPFFYVCFTAGRLILLLARKDPLHRQFRTNLKTYWSERKPIPGPEHYTRQY